VTPGDAELNGPAREDRRPVRAARPRPFPAGRRAGPAVRTGELSSPPFMPGFLRALGAHIGPEVHITVSTRNRKDHGEFST
jgi:hypothetical protein